MVAEATSAFTTGECWTIGLIVVALISLSISELYIMIKNDDPELNNFFDED